MFTFAKAPAFATVAKTPTRASTGSAGYDLAAAEDVVIEPNTWKGVDTGIILQIPTTECYARIAPRSGLAFKRGIDVLAGVIDSDYRDSIKVILMNHGPTPFTIKAGDRIAQFIIERVLTPNLVEIPHGHLTSTERGTGGFGSTGK